MRTLVCLGCFLFAMMLLQRFDAPQSLPLVKADYPVCMTVRPGPLKPRLRPIFNPRASETA
jgi:hypothetical protein